MKHEAFRSYFLAVALGSAGLCELILHPITTANGLVIVLVSVIAFLLPWQRWVVLRRTLNVAAAAVLFYDGVVIMTRTTEDGLPWWVWCIAFLVFATALCYCGAPAVRYGGALLGVVLAVLLVLAFFLCIPMYSVPMPIFLGGIQTVPLGVIVLVGGGLTAVEFSDQYRAVRWGGITACLLWASAAATVYGVWSAPALTKLSMPLITAWQRITVFSVFSCPNVPIVCVLAAACVWQIGAVGTMFRYLLTKNNIFKS